MLHYYLVDYQTLMILALEYVKRKAFDDYNRKVPSTEESDQIALKTVHHPNKNNYIECTYCHKKI